MLLTVHVAELPINQSINRFIGCLIVHVAVAAPLPPWSQSGAVVGLEGGGALVPEIVRNLTRNDVPLAGVLS